MVVTLCSALLINVFMCSYECVSALDVMCSYLCISALDVMCSCVHISAVKRLKYLIVINRIYVIVNSKLIAINRKFLSILNVPSFIYFFHHFFYFNALINMEKWIGLLYANVLFYWKPILPNRAVQNKIIKCTFQVNKAYSAVKPWLNIFFFSSLLGK